MSGRQTFQRYLGDGVFCEFDGFQVWLGLERGQRLIALEPSVLSALDDYCAFIARKVREGEEVTPSPGE